MAIIHPATLTPGKLDLLAAWLPGRSWFPGPEADGLERVGAARFDDPAGAVGVEIFLVRTPGGPLVQVPMTYRGAPLEGAGEWLIGTCEHSVLGTRWVYDGVADPVFVATVTEAIHTGGHEATEYLETPEGPVAREPLMTLRGSGAGGPGRPATILRVADGDPAVVSTDAGELTVLRRPETTPSGGGQTLTAAWPGGSVTLAVLR